MEGDQTFPVDVTPSPEKDKYAVGTDGPGAIKTRLNMTETESGLLDEGLMEGVQI